MMRPSRRLAGFLPGLVIAALAAAAAPLGGAGTAEPATPPATGPGAPRDAPPATGQDAPPAARPAPPLAPPSTPPAAPAPGTVRSSPLDPVVAPDGAFRDAWDLDPRHARMVLVDGLPVLGSSRVPDAALREAAWIVRSMTRARPELIEPIAAARVRLVVMSHDEFTSDVPEHRDLEPRAFWDRRARGLGATRSRPALSCGTENLLGYPGDPYAGESILVHELAHAVHEFALATLEPGFDRRLAAAYDAAMVAGRWEGTYASTNRHEYFAEGVQAYFDTNRADDREHNHVDTREELLEQDPRLFALIDEAFGRNPWRYRPPADRRRMAHLRAATGSDEEAAPRFEWPERIVAAFEAHRARTRRQLVRLEVRPVGGGSAPSASGDDGGKSRIRFVNRTGGSLRLAWIDALGAPRSFGWVRAGGHRDQPTFAGHAWLLMDRDGRPVAWTVADERPGLALIPGPDGAVGGAGDPAAVGEDDPDGLMPPSRR